jgi:hypothetical protein
MRSFLARRRLEILFAGCLLMVLAPLTQSRVLPFHDASGIVGLGGALARLDDPEARIPAFYDVDIRPYPSVLYFGWAYLAGKLGLSVETAFSLFMALFSIAGPALGLLLLLRAFGRPPYLALLAFPVSYHHQVWFGFLGSSASITGMLLALAFGKRVVDRARPGDHLALAAALLLVATAHPFPMALTCALLAPLLLWPSPGCQMGSGAFFARAGLRAACFLPALLFLGGWVGSFFGGNAGGVPVLARIRREVRLRVPSPLEDAGLFLRWLGDGYTTRWDELVPGVALLTLVAFLLVGARPAVAKAAEPTAKDRGWIWLAWAALVLGLGYLLLPMKLMWPNEWWGVRVRCVAPLFLVLVALVRPRPRGLPSWALAPALALGLLFAGYVAYDFRTHWRGRVLDGFDQALAAIPPGQSVLAFPVLPDRRYNEAHPYLVQHYVARKGGRALPHLRGHPGSYWITMKEPPPAPPWGDPRQFVWQEHAAGWDYFLLQIPVDGPAPDPFVDAPAGAVRRVSARGQWVVYRKVQ